MARQVLATRVGGAEDLLDDSELLSPGDVDSWEQSLKKCLSRPADSLIRGQELRQKAIELFDVENNKKKFWQIVSDTCAVTT